VRLALAVALAALALPAGALAWGGQYASGDPLGTSVTVQVSDSYPVDDALPQTWATFLGSLVHGAELSRLTLDLATGDEVAHTCGMGALACYDPATMTIHATPDDQAGEPPAKEIVMHEYGHHIAANASNPPWLADDWGTKRWASYENICAKTAQGVLAPGDEGGNYALNPGEAFAEAYRVLNLTKEGAPDISWDLVSRTFYPDATALQLLEQDIVDPWTGPTVRTLRGSFGYGRFRTFGLVTPLDGSLSLVLHAPTRSRLRLELSSGPKTLGRGTRLALQVCGQRTFTLRVERLSGSGSFTVSLSKP
jgi:hypothetical protein